MAPSSTTECITAALRASPGVRLVGDRHESVPRWNVVLADSAQGEWQATLSLHGGKGRPRSLEFAVVSMGFDVPSSVVRTHAQRGTPLLAYLVRACAPAAELNIACQVVGIGSSRECEAAA